MATLVKEAQKAPLIPFVALVGLSLLSGPLVSCIGDLRAPASWMEWVAVAAQVALCMTFLFIVLCKITGRQTSKVIVEEKAPLTPLVLFVALSLSTGPLIPGIINFHAPALWQDWVLIVLQVMVAAILLLLALCKFAERLVPKAAFVEKRSVPLLPPSQQ